MVIKLIALDLDGTLLNSKKLITDRTIRALRLCADNGILIVPATGRTEGGIPSDLKNLTGVHYAITTNGAVVYDLLEKEVILKQGIFWETAVEIIDLLKKWPVMYDAYVRGRGKCERRFLERLEVYGMVEEVCRLIRATRDEVSDLQDYIQQERCFVDKINIMFEDRTCKAAVRRELEQSKKVLVTSSMPGNLELNARGVTKGSGLAFLQKHLHLKREEIMAFGDGENDLPMLLEAGTGVAMSNGTSYLKEKADIVAASNDEDGVADILERIMKKQG